jgi:hypothetical protein
MLRKAGNLIKNSKIPQANFVKYDIKISPTKYFVTTLIVYKSPNLLAAFRNRFVVKK